MERPADRWDRRLNVFRYKNIVLLGIALAIAIALFFILRAPRSARIEALEEEPVVSRVFPRERITPVGTLEAEVYYPAVASVDPVTATSILSAVAGGPESERALPKDLVFRAIQYSAPLQSRPTAHSRLFTQFILEAAFRPGRHLRFGVGGEAKKLYEIEAVGEEELIFSDPVLFAEYRFWDAGNGIRSTAIVSSSLPYSTQSRSERLITRSVLGFALSADLIDRRLRAEITPALSYRFNHYTSNDNRVPLEKFELGATASLRGAIGPRILLGIWVRPRQRYFEQYDDRAAAPTAGMQWDAGTFVDFGISDVLRAEVGFSQGQSALHTARYSEFSYDAASARAYAGISLTL